mgnify:CR=1 FL=1
MTNQTVAPIAEINTLEAEGLALAKEWKSICKADKARFAKSTKADGFDTRLGKLMFALKQEGGQRISSQRLRDCGIAEIAKQRRAEALWFIENEDAARAFMKTSKKGFTSLSALQKAMAKQSKTEDKPTAEPKGSDDDAKSDVGPDESKTQEQSSVTASDIALEALVQCEANGIAIEDFMLALKEQLVLVDNKVAA